MPKGIYIHKPRLEETKRKIGKANTGKHHTEETKKKLSEIKKGKYHSEETKKKMSESHRGHKVSEETKRKIGLANSIALKGYMPWNKGMKGFLAGKKHYNWQGGKSFEPYGLEFDDKLKEQIRKRDNYRCQECFRHQDELVKNTKAGLRHYKLFIHHIDYNKQNNEPDNLTSLCLSCHAQTNFNRTDWTEYFKNK